MNTCGLGFLNDERIECSPAGSSISIAIGRPSTAAPSWVCAVGLSATLPIFAPTASFAPPPRDTQRSASTAATCICKDIWVTGLTRADLSLLPILYGV